jgi:hypothetical protein
MTSSNSLLVDHTLVPIGPGAEPYPADGEWAEPSIEHASKLMRQLFDDPARARELGAIAAEQIHASHSPEAAGEVMCRRLESIRGTGCPHRSLRPARPHGGALATLPTVIREGPPSTAVGRPRHARAIAKRGLLRLMRPFTQYQQSVNARMVASLEELHAAIEDERREAARERARLLAELRRLADSKPGTGA